MSSQEVRPVNGELSDVDRFRDMMSMFPTGVSVVTAAEPDGTPQGATCSSLSSVTLTPPTLLVCLQLGGATIKAIEATKQFAVNLLRSDAQRTAEVFSSPHEDRFAQVPWQALSPRGLPHLDRDAFAMAECEVTHEFVIGDHMVIAGAVANVRLSAAAPLLYGLRRFTAWPPSEHPSPSTAKGIVP